MISLEELQREFVKINYFKFRTVLVSISITAVIMFFIISCEPPCSMLVMKETRAVTSKSYNNINSLKKSQPSSDERRMIHISKNRAYVWNYELDRGSKNLLTGSCLDAADERYVCIWTKVVGDFTLEEWNTYTITNSNLIIEGSVRGKGTIKMEGYPSELIIQGAKDDNVNIELCEGCTVEYDQTLSSGGTTGVSRKEITVPCGTDLNTWRISEDGSKEHRYTQY